jgi:hypothetical protein
MRFRSKLVVLSTILLAAAGCTWSMHVAAPGQRSTAKVKPVQIIEGPGAETGAEPPAAEEPPAPLMNELKRQEAAIAESKKQPAPPAAAVPEKTTAAEAAPAAPPQADATKTETAAQAQPELTAEYLVAQMEAKPSRTPAEEAAYKRLLGIAEGPTPPADGGDSYALLGQARDALLAGNLASARDLAGRAVAALRSKTDPVIDGVYFATAVRNYGNADYISPARFKPGQRVLLVTDLSNFACEAAASGNSPERFTTKMTQRVAIYDGSGKLAWQRSFEAQEYQSSHYISTMFIPRIFALPADVAAGQYTIKVEIIDHLSNRQCESGTQFSIE